MQPCILKQDKAEEGEVKKTFILSPQEQCYTIWQEKWSCISHIREIRPCDRAHKEKQMMKKNRNRTLLLMLLLLSMLMSGCGAAGHTRSSEGITSIPEASGVEKKVENFDTSAEDSAKKDMAYSSPSMQQQSNAKLIRNASLSIEVKNLTESIELLNTKIGAVSGYIESSNLNFSEGDSYYSRRSGNIIARVPSEKYKEYLDSLSEIGQITNISENTTDVTLEYRDTESHKEALRVEEERLLELLKQADSIETILSIEDRLSGVRYELGNYDSQLKVFDNQVDYSTFTLSLYEVREFTSVDNSMTARIKIGFLQNARFVINFIKELFIFLVTHLPSIAFLGVIVLFLVLLLNRKTKNFKKKLENPPAKAQEQTKKDEIGSGDNR